MCKGCHSASGKGGTTGTVPLALVGPSQDSGMKRRTSSSQGGRRTAPAPRPDRRQGAVSPPTPHPRNPRWGRRGQPSLGTPLRRRLPRAGAQCQPARARLQFTALRPQEGLCGAASCPGSSSLLHAQVKRKGACSWHQPSGRPALGPLAPISASRCPPLSVPVPRLNPQPLPEANQAGLPWPEMHSQCTGPGTAIARCP